MKKFIWVSATFILIIGMILGGCGTSSESSIEADIVPAAYDDVISDSDIIEESTESVVNEQNTQNELEDIDFGNPLEEDLVPGDELVKNEEEQVEPEDDELEGIIMLRADGTTNFRVFSLEVSIINSNTGDYRKISSFVFDNTVLDQDNDFAVVPTTGYYSNYRNLFNDDFTLVAATKTFASNNETHAGWVDQSGEFFDVTLALNEQAQSEFEETRYFEAMGFTTDGNFVYKEIAYREWDKYYMVPLDNITPGASYEIEYTHPYIRGNRGDNTWEWAEDYRVTCWVDDNRFLATIVTDPKLLIMNCVLVNVAEQTSVELVPTGSQSSWSPVISPDGVTVAFLSAATTGNDHDQPSIYLTDLSGGNTPTKLETSYPIFSSRDGGKGAPVQFISRGYCYSSILEWR